MTKQEFINRVLLIMNEAGMMTNQGLVMVGADTTQVDRHIEGTFVDAWRRCIKVMPRMWFGNKSFISAEKIADLTNGTGYIILPDDFYLLTSFKMAGWQKAVMEASVENERTANIQSNEYTRGSIIRPACTLSVKNVSGSLKNVLNYYTLPKGLQTHTVEEAIYIPVIKPLSEVSDPTTELGLSDQIIEPMAYLSASTVLTMFEKYDVAKALEMRALEMFPGLQSVIGKNITTKQ